MRIDITDVGATIHRLSLCNALPQRDLNLEAHWLEALTEALPDMTPDELRRATIRIGVSHVTGAPPVTPTTITDEVHFERDSGILRGAK